MQALSTNKTSPVKRAASAGFRQRCASALMHPVTLGALGVLLVNDLMFKALWPGAWVPGKLSDLAWMMFAPPVLAYVLSFATRGNQQAQRVAFLTAYAGLPLLYVAFNTFQPVHDVVLHVLGFGGGDGPRSPLDPTDSLVIPVAMAAAIWVWSRPPLEAQSIRTRLALLAATAAVLASVATSFGVDYGVIQVGRTASGRLGAITFFGSGDSMDGVFESVDGGLTWTNAGEQSATLEKRQFMELGEREPSGIFSGGRIRITNHEVMSSAEVVYSFKYLQNGGNRWMQALDKRDVQDAVIATGHSDFFYDGQSGNLLLAMGLQGVVVIAPDGTATQVAVGRYSPTDFSYWGKTRTLFNSLSFRGMTAFNTGTALLLAFSFAALAVVGSSTMSGIAAISLAIAAAISAFLGVTVGVYPSVSGHPSEDGSGWSYVGYFALLGSGFGSLPLLLVIAGLVFARISFKELVALVAATTGVLLLICAGALVLFETGSLIANFVVVGLAALGLWAYLNRRRFG